MHTKRCRFAKTDVAKCRCSCKGILHGLDPSERKIHDDMERIKIDEVEQ
jgi:hypothetical protein